jgi:hypothetical protein
MDPFTEKRDLVLEYSNVEVEAGKTAFGIYDIHASAIQTDSRGKSYQDW